ncbi:MAG: adenylate/guanylate cyclase domain-containing protein [Phyllobacterium sp.]|uniref:adenylate/guanylate cyclase domain-containing protein n=1 Tax=Phyllobacterium sp. TaxID=1871046 RepID=UPI0030F15BEC
MRDQPRRRTINGGSVLAIIEWLSGDECHSLDEAGLIFGLGRQLQAIGLPVDRLTLHLMTLHPEYLGRSVAWAPEEPVEIHDRLHGAVSPAFLDSALRQSMKTREIIIAGREGAGASWQYMDIFAARELVQLFIVPLCNADGPVSAAAFGTKRPTGFTESERQIIERIMPALRNACELRTLRQVELSLLDTYVGPLTAQRILGGRIRQGEIESIDAALLLCDLRGFTELSNRLPASEVMQLLNGYFDTVVPAITGQGGEVLKFMGDAVLAFFPGYSAAWATAAASQAATEILEKIETTQIAGMKVSVGVALHYGEVSYGNIGSGRRLDFTLIGPDVNMVSRIQHVCSQEGRELLMSAPFVIANGSGIENSIGTRLLKGFKNPVELFEGK